MSRVLVYRVEDAEGRGMYATMPDRMDCYAGAAGLETWASDRHPMPYADSLYHNNWLDAGGPMDGFVFGFKDLDQLRSWLYQDSVRVGLRSMGFKVSVYEVEEIKCIVGYTQLTFEKEKRGRLTAQPVATLDLVELHEIPNALENLNETQRTGNVPRDSGTVSGRFSSSSAWLDSNLPKLSPELGDSGDGGLGGAPDLRGIGAVSSERLCAALFDALGSAGRRI